MRILISLIFSLLCAPAFGQSGIGVADFNRSMTTTTGPSFLRLPPSYINARVLAANTAESATPPTSARYVIFSASCAAFYVLVGGTATVPAGDVTDGTASELNPSGYSIEGPTAISIISPTTCTVTLTFYTR